MTTVSGVLRTATLAGALALAAHPALAFGGHGGGGFHGGGWHGDHAGWGGGGWGWGVPFVGVGIGGPWYGGAYYDDDYGGCALRRVQVQTAYGLRWRTVRYCY